MNIEMFDEAIEAPKKQHRNKTTQILNTFVDSDKKAMMVTCDTVRDAINLNCGMYNLVTKRNLAIKVWRNNNEVYAQKED